MLTERPAEVLIEGVTEDLTVYRDTVFLLVEEGVAIEDALRWVCTSHDLHLSELAFAPSDVWAGSGARPASDAPKVFLALVSPLPDTCTAFGGCEMLIVDMLDEAWRPWGWA